MAFPFGPTFHTNDLEDLLDWDPHHITQIGNSALFQKVEELTRFAHPDQDHEFDASWHSFYFPALHEGRRVTFPVHLNFYKTGNVYSLVIDTGKLLFFEVANGQEKTEKGLFTLIEEISRFLPHLRQHGRNVLNVPYEIRRGKTTSALLFEKPLSDEERAQIERRYEDYSKKDQIANGISLEEYLETAALIYKVLFGKEAESLSPREMYRRWSYDHGGHMLTIKNPRSRKQFANWYQSKEWAGSHPFSLWGKRMAVLYPPREGQPYFTFSLRTVPDPQHYKKVLFSFMEHQVPFRVQDLSERLDFLTGQATVDVNRGEAPLFFYLPGREDKQQYFSRIRWEPLPIPNWK
ncbi:hypothetical protein J4421_01265 [Candidatus Woesearchaeota archaeon]|nr:hypothetical protein [Candidatus Woesearchaeota archaeon]